MTNSRLSATESMATVAAREAATLAEPPSPRLPRLLRSNAAISVLSVVLALIVGAILIVLTSSQVTSAAGYFFSRPSDTFVAIGTAVGSAYAAVFTGGIVDFAAPDIGTALQPLFSSLSFATPLIAGGLGIAVGFRAGVFNIGGQGQMLVGGAVAGWISFALPLPPVVHLLVAVGGGMIGGLVWAGIAGLLRAATGAHEVIVTIMLNYIGFYLVDQLLHTSVLKAPGSVSPKSPPADASAVFPVIGGNAGLTTGILAAILAALAVWWIFARSSLGYKFRAVGLNPAAAATAGMNVPLLGVGAMLVSGALVGLAGAFQVLGQTTTGFTSSFDAGIGFQAITVALLGRSRPWGVFGAGILFGIFQAGGYRMQAAVGVDLNLIGVIQALIVLFIAAPPLVRAIFHLDKRARTASARRKVAS